MPIFQLTPFLFIPLLRVFFYLSLSLFILSRSLILSRSFFRRSAVMRRRFNTINMLTVLLVTKARQPTQPDKHTHTYAPSHAHPHRHLATGARCPSPPSTAWQHCFFLATNETMSTKIPKQKTPNESNRGRRAERDTKSEREQERGGEQVRAPTHSSQNKRVNTERAAQPLR